MKRAWNPFIYSHLARCVWVYECVFVQHPPFTIRHKRIYKLIKWMWTRNEQTRIQKIPMVSVLERNKETLQNQYIEAIIVYINKRKIYTNLSRFVFMWNIERNMGVECFLFMFAVSRSISTNFHWDEQKIRFNIS